MTDKNQCNLETYLKRKETQSIDVLVSIGDEFPHAEIHPFGQDELAQYRKLWTQEYYRAEEIRNVLKKEAATEAKRQSNLRRAQARKRVEARKKKVEYNAPCRTCGQAWGIHRYGRPSIVNGFWACAKFQPMPECNE